MGRRYQCARARNLELPVLVILDLQVALLLLIPWSCHPECPGARARVEDEKCCRHHQTEDSVETWSAFCSTQEVQVSLEVWEADMNSPLGLPHQLDGRCGENSRGLGHQGRCHRCALCALCLSRVNQMVCTCNIKAQVTSQFISVEVFPHHWTHFHGNSDCWILSPPGTPQFTLVDPSSHWQTPIHTG